MKKYCKNSKQNKRVEGICMGLVIIFALVTLLAVYSSLKTLRDKNLLAGGFSVATVLVFGWFTVMTVLNNGYPPTH